MIDHAGESRQIRQEGAALTAILAFAVVLIYLVLAAQFHSFRDPLIVRPGSAPLAISGAPDPLSWVRISVFPRPVGISADHALCG